MSNNCKSIVYKEDIVDNKGRYKTANKQYQLMYIETKTGFRPCMMTEAELKNGFKRASKNPEDLKGLELVKPKRTFWQWLTRT